MAIDHHSRDHIVTSPGEVVGATIPGQSETREGHDTTHEAGPARLSTRRRFLYSAAGASALVLFGGLGIYTASSGEQAPAAPAPATAPETLPTAEASAAFEAKDLTINQMEMPETLDQKTFPDIIAGVGQAIEYAVNKGDRELIRRLIPGGLTGTEGTLQPGQFELRAAFIKGFRESSQGTGNDNPNDPQNERYYAWGFKMESLDTPNPLDAPPEKVTGYSGLVRITMGDLPPMPTLTTNELNMEPPQTFEVEVELTRYAIDDNGRSKNLPNIVAAGDSWKTAEGKGWALASVGKMYPIPPIMAASHTSHGFQEVPPLFKES